jgi:folate-binding protein YgfZ
MNLDVYRRILAGESLTYVLSPRTIWQLTGPDARRYLNGQVTNDVTGLANGQVCYAAVCTAKGRMEGDLFITFHETEFYLDTDLVLRESLGARLQKYLIADDASFEDVSDLWSLSHVFGNMPSSIPNTSFAVPHARFGLPGHDLWIPGSNAVIVGEIVKTDMIETLRLECGLPRWSAELTPTTLPPEAGPHMLEAISYTKGCYVGQETIARLKSVGHVNRTLVFLQSSSAFFPTTGTKIMQTDHEIGVITSAGYSPCLEKGIALGYVQRQAAEEGTSLHADGMTLTVSAPLHKGARPC